MEQPSTTITMKRPWFYIVIGSKSDLPAIEGAKEVLRKLNVGYKVRIHSAHRHAKQMPAFLKELLAQKPNCILAGAGWNAALPGSLASGTEFTIPVLGVAISSEEYPNAEDAMLAISRMPKGCPVAFMGTGKVGFRNAALYACSFIATGEDLRSVALKNDLIAYRQAEAGEPEEVEVWQPEGGHTGTD